MRDLFFRAALTLALPLAVAAAGAQQTPTGGAQKSASRQINSSKPRTKAAGERPFGIMSEAAGCTVLNRGKHGQICYYDVTRLRPERAAQSGPDLPIFISVRNHDTILWHSGAGAPFHVIGITLRAGQNSHCPRQAFDNDFRDNDADPWNDVVSSGLPNPLAGRYQCEYKTHIKWKDGKLGDPHIIVGDNSPPGP